MFILINAGDEKVRRAIYPIAKGKSFFDDFYSVRVNPTDDPIIFPVTFSIDDSSCQKFHSPQKKEILRAEFLREMDKGHHNSLMCLFENPLFPSIIFGGGTFLGIPSLVLWTLAAAALGHVGLRSCGITAFGC